MHPVLFYIGNSPVNSYSFFVAMAILAGSLLYFYLTRNNKIPPEKRILLWTGGLAGGLAGAKLADVVYSLDIYLNQDKGSRTVLGGIIGGYFGVKIVKRMLGIAEKTGDPLALATLLAMGTGRIGCFLGGCCYGKPVSAWYAVFMAGQYRYPTQLMEMAFDFTLLGVLWTLRNKMKYPGDLFKLFVTSYALFRFFIEFIRVEPVIWHGLTIYQVMAVPLVITGGFYFGVRYLLCGRG